MSRLLKETDDYLELEEWLYNNNGSFSEWEVDGGKLKYSELIQEAEHFAVTEVRVAYRIYKETGKVEFLSVDAF